MCHIFYRFCMSTNTRHSWVIEAIPFPLQPQEESIEEVIKDTESLFKSREKEYQETIDQIEVRAQRSVQQYGFDQHFMC